VGFNSRRVRNEQAECSGIEEDMFNGSSFIICLRDRFAVGSSAIVPTDMRS
jgi:hypothetical protein